MFSDFDFSVLDDPNYKEDAVREDLICPLMKALGYLPTGKQRMQRSQPLLHPFVMIGSQKRKIHIVPDYTLLHDDEVVLVLDAKRPTESIINSVHVEQAFSYAIHPSIRAKSYALCNGRELVLYDIDRSGPVFQVSLKDVGERWPEVQKHFAPEALIDHLHRSFKPDLGIFLKNAGFDQSHSITFMDMPLNSLGQTAGGVLTASTCPELVEGMSFEGSFDMPMDVLPSLVSCLPEQAGKMVKNALSVPCSNVWLGGAIQVTWTAQLGVEEIGQYEHDPLIPLCVTVLRAVSRGSKMGFPVDGLPPGTLNLPTILQFM